MKEIMIFHEAIKDVSAIASKIKAKPKKIIGYLCSDLKRTTLQI